MTMENKGFEGSFCGMILRISLDSTRGNPSTSKMALRFCFSNRLCILCLMAKCLQNPATETEVYGNLSSRRERFRIDQRSKDVKKLWGKCTSGRHIGSSEFCPGNKNPRTGLDNHWMFRCVLKLECGRLQELDHKTTLSRALVYSLL